jgi:hypothetical protein
VEVVTKAKSVIPVGQEPESYSCREQPVCPLATRSIVASMILSVASRSSRPLSLRAWDIAETDKVFELTAEVLTLPIFFASNAIYAIDITPG